MTRIRQVQKRGYYKSFHPKENISMKYTQYRGKFVSKIYKGKKKTTTHRVKSMKSSRRNRQKYTQ